MAVFDNCTSAFLILASLAGFACEGTASGEGESSPSAATHAEGVNESRTWATTRCERVERLTDLGVLDSNALHPSSRALALNHAGTVVGYSATELANREPSQHAFRWTRRTAMVDLGTLGGPNSSAVDVNDHEEIAGNSQAADGYQHAVIWNARGQIHD